jgi:hypothetical protein
LTQYGSAATTIPCASSILIIRNSCSATQLFPQKCGNGIDLQKKSPQIFFPKTKNAGTVTSKTNPAKMRERNPSSKKIHLKKIPQRLFPQKCGNGINLQKNCSQQLFLHFCGNGIKFSKNSPQKIPRKLFPPRCGNGINFQNI